MDSIIVREAYIIYSVPNKHTFIKFSHIQYRAHENNLYYHYASSVTVVGEPIAVFYVYNISYHFLDLQLMSVTNR